MKPSDEPQNGHFNIKNDKSKVGESQVCNLRTTHFSDDEILSYSLYVVQSTFFSGCGARSGGGGHLYFRLDVILVKGLSKHTLNTYFSSMKIDPKYSFLHAFFLNLCVMSFPKFVNMTKTHLFFPISHVFAPLNDVRAYIAWS